jgi:hypothetical protein
MLVENPTTKEPLHWTLALDPTAKIARLQKAFTDGNLTYREGGVYVTPDLASIGETILLDIPGQGVLAVPFITNLREMNLPMFTKVLEAYESKRASLRNQYLVKNNGSTDYKAFLDDLASKHPASKATPSNLYQSISWIAGLGKLTDKELQTLSKDELPHLFGTIVQDMEDIPLKELNTLLESAGLEKADANQDRKTSEKLLAEREKLLQDMIQHARKILNKTGTTAESTFAEAYAQLDTTKEKLSVDHFFESKSTQISA